MLTGQAARVRSYRSAYVRAELQLLRLDVRYDSAIVDFCSRKMWTTNCGRPDWRAFTIMDPKGGRYRCWTLDPLSLSPDIAKTFAVLRRQVKKSYVFIYICVFYSIAY